MSISGVAIYLDAHQFSEFEVLWDVTRVKRYSPTEIDISTTTKDDGGRQVDSIWGFKLVDHGKALAARKPGGSFFRKCPVLKDDD